MLHTVFTAVFVRFTGEVALKLPVHSINVSRMYQFFKGPDVIAHINVFQAKHPFESR